MEERKPVSDQWGDYLNNFLKAGNVTNEEQPFVVVTIEEKEFDDGKTIRLHLEGKDEKDKLIKYLFDLNKTNTGFLKNNISAPKDVVGRKIYFKKVETRNPQTNQPAEGLRICKIED